MFPSDFGTLHPRESRHNSQGPKHDRCNHERPGALNVPCGGNDNERYTRPSSPVSQALNRISSSMLLKTHRPFWKKKDRQMEVTETKSDHSFFGDDITVHRRDFPVAVWEGHSNHEPGNEPQKEGKGFHYRVHASFAFFSQAGKRWCAGLSAPEVQRPGTRVIGSKALMLLKSTDESLIAKHPSRFPPLFSTVFAELKKERWTNPGEVQPPSSFMPADLQRFGTSWHQLWTLCQ